MNDTNTFLYQLLAILLCCLFVTGCTGFYEADTDHANKQNNMSMKEDSLAVDVSHMTSVDGQPLVREPVIKKAPEQPLESQTYDVTDSAYWYDHEYFYTSSLKENIPSSPGDGTFNKKVISIVNGNHPYMTAYGIGAKRIADAYGIDFVQYSSDWNLDLHNNQIDLAIEASPDLIIINPLDMDKSLEQLKKINDRGIPCIVSNMMPEKEAMKYAITWTGPDDWGQFRELTRLLADEMNGTGGIAILTHAVGGSVYYARLMAPITELSVYAPDINVLDSQYPEFDRIKTKEVVSNWINVYGNDLNAIICAEDYTQVLGTLDAVSEMGREDLLIVAAGHSKTGMDAVMRGDVLAITYQSAQVDGAMAMKAAADWFNGLEVPEVMFMQSRIITQKDVMDFMPAEW